MADEGKLEDKIREIARSAFDTGGLEALKQAEDLFFGEAAGIRKKERKGSLANQVSLVGLDRDRYSEIIGSSKLMLNVFALLDRVAPSSVPVLIQGESGTGKELVAHAIHKNSPRADKRFVAENCSAIPETLLESELFGYRRGAFTGAEKNKKGLFEAADKGTLFLDEIGDMSLGMQKKLLRVLQDGETRPVGANSIVYVDVRLVTASNKNLQEMVRKRGFREDLYFRLNTITISLPPLRDRKEDIPELVEFFMKKVSGELERNGMSVTAEAMDAFTRYRWPGNIRELENEMRRCLALKAEGKIIGLDDLSDDVKD